MTIPAFVDYSPATPITASYLNAVASTVYGALGDASNNPPTSAAQVLTNLGLSSQVGGGGTSKIGFDGTTLDQQFLSRVNRVCSSIAELKGLNHTTYTRAFLTGYYAVGDGGGGEYWYDPSDTTSADNGGTIIVATDGARWKLTQTSTVTLAQFGAKQDGTDQSTAINNALAWLATQTNVELDVSGNFSAVQVTATGLAGAQLKGRCSLIGIAAAATDSLLTLINCTDISINGRFVLNGNYNTNYTYGVHAYTTGAGTVAYLDFTNMPVIGFKSAYGFGSAAIPNAQVSEINVRGGYNYGCPNVITAIGAQTVVNFQGSNIISNYGNGNAAWQAIVQYTVVSIGATVNISGGEALHAQLTTGALVQVQPIAATSGNLYGNVTFAGVVIECASPLAVTSNPNALATPTQGAINFIGCRGVCSWTGAGAWIQTDASYGAGNSLQFGRNSFFATAAQTNGTINCGAACDVFCDDSSFQKNFSTALAGILGGVPHFSHRLIFMANNLNGEFFPVSATTVANFTVVSQTNDLARYHASYSAGTFTTNQAFKNMRVFGQIQSLTAIASGQILVNENGVALGKGIYNVLGQVSLDLQDVASGTTLAIAVTNNSGSTNAGSTNLDYMTIWASA